MEIAIGCDHAGVEVKWEISAMLKESGITVYDCGTNTLAAVDYPDIAEQVAAEVLSRDILGILVCGTGIGISIAANKIPGIRAAVCTDIFTAEMCRKHNDANIIAVGARVSDINNIKEIVSTFIKTDFEGGRHQIRVEKIKALENKFRKRCC
ncbi:Ribose 5-phosphate isomerase B [Syntrophomonas zehnderi OL-4]|uniref:Ribose 5-phosphate isomerase B n=1 Tax=Syntrophomonas zehnderi OL-4 TaxID=690567 RepID=A0A0E4C7I6_9FIRM|nr:ribose 5-phosphate isomerase B [Syntrophomonas zehnderi]CFX02763.1 Ribose 5-phosphate isomerase B [Syntrophomonas zehnderi OL-4]